MIRKMEEKNKYDLMILGPVSKDILIDCHGERTELLGGAVLQSGWAASGIGANVVLYTKYNMKEVNITEELEKFPKDVYCSHSEHTTSIINQYFTEDKEKRECSLVNKCDSFKIEEIPDVKVGTYHLAGLVVGDFEESFIKELSKKGKVAVDVQCFLRKADETGAMNFEDWKLKKECLPYIHYFKADAAEAKILTGEDDLEKAAIKLYEWGANEVLLTHNTEVLAYDGKTIERCPIKSNNFSGRTGRGDTCFAGYISERKDRSVKEALTFATALVSLKMETPGVFRGNRDDVCQYIRDRYEMA